MRTSEQLRKEAQQEENDFAYMGKMKKVFREERDEKFKDVWMAKLLAKGYKIEETSIGKYVITTDTKYGILEFFPKSNRVFVKVLAKTTKNKGWYSSGLNWIKTRILE